MIRAYLASPYRSHVCYKTDGPTAPLTAAMLALLRLRHKLRPVFCVYDVRRSQVPCVWSPLIEGDIRRAEGYIQNEDDALRWCFYHLKSSGFTHVINCSDDTIPRAPGYGKNGCDREVALAESIGMPVMRETEFLNA